MDEETLDTAAAPEASAPAPAPETPSSTDDDLDASLREAYRAASEPEKVEEEGKEEPEVIAPEAMEIEPPGFWDEELKDKWAALPPEAQKLVTEREEQVNAYVDEVETLFEAFQPLGQTIDRWGQYVQYVGRPPHEMINDMFAASYMLDTQPAEAIAKLAEMYGVDLASLVNWAAPAPDPDMARLKAENMALQRAEMARQEQARLHAERQQQAILQASAKAADEFTSSIPELQHGTPTFDQQFADEFIRSVTMLRSANPHADEKAILKEAHERTSWIVPTTRQRLLAEEAAKSQKATITAAKQISQRAKTAASRPVGTDTPSPGQMSIDDDLRAVYRRMTAA